MFSKYILLKYHYRCGKKIIGFSNQRYYNNSLNLSSVSSIGELELIDIKNKNVKQKNEAFEEANEIVNYINDASKTTRLSALFNGEWNKEVSLMTENGTIYYNDDNYYVRYHYATQQELKVNNETKNATYAELVFTVSKIDEKAEYKVYVIPDATKSSTYSHYYTIEADFGTLYKYLENNFAK